MKVFALDEDVWLFAGDGGAAERVYGVHDGADVGVRELLEGVFVAVIEVHVLDEAVGDLGGVMCFAHAYF